MKNKNCVIKTLGQFVACIEKNYSKGKFLFRGQLVKDKLLPKFFRKETDVKLRKQKTELAMLEDFKRRSRPFLKIKPESESEWLALSQHYGMPTRLLDWTSSAFAALWFAVVHKRPVKNNNGVDGVVWVLDFTKMVLNDPKKPFEIKKQKSFIPHILKSVLLHKGVGLRFI